MNNHEKEITEAELMAYIDGELPAERVALIEANETLLAEARRLKSTGAILRGAYDRHFCPPADDLLIYSAGFLEKSAADLIEEHLSGCDACQLETDRLNRIQETASEDYVTDSWLTQLRNSGRQVIKAVLRPRPADAPQLRGGADEYLLFDAGPYQISIVKKPPIIEEMGWSIEGQIFDRENLSLKLSHTLILYKNKKELSQVAINSFGYFTVEELISGSYIGIFSINDHQISISIEV